MTFPESEFLDCVTLARMYDSSKEGIHEMLAVLQGRGHRIEVLRWGKQGKLKVHGKQFRVALMREFQQQ